LRKEVGLGVHVDGFAAFFIRTIVVKSDKDAQYPKKKAKMVLAAYKASCPSCSEVDKT